MDGGTTSTAVTFSGLSLTGGTDYIVIIGGQASTQNSSGCLTIQPQCSAIYTNTLVNDCGAATYSRTLNFSNLGSAASVSITDGTTSYNNISTGVNYVFSYTDLLDYAVAVNGYDGGANLICSETIEFTSGCNGTETCTGAPDITNTCSPGDLTGAINEGTLANNPACGNGVNVRTCTGGFSPSSNYEDIWYAIDNIGYVG